MTNIGDLHKIQADILKELMFVHDARFSDLNISKMPNDQFTFHLKRLVELGLIEKTVEGTYRLTIPGKDYAGRLDTDSKVVALETQAKIGVLVVATQGEKYLVQQRLKQPYYGYHGFITGKIKRGETVLEAAARELEEETGLEGDLRLSAVKHKMDYSASGELLDDKYFFTVRVDNVSGGLHSEFPGGKNCWMTKEEIFKLPTLFDGVEESLKLILNSAFAFVETKYTVEGF
ncbi:MAG: NUDIX domain-containing protein [Patescibacteria group bacterium]